VITHPEMLAIAYLLLGRLHAPVRPGHITASPGFDCPSRPDPRDPLQLYLAGE
jgi:hypothetical protein